MKRKLYFLTIFMCIFGGLGLSNLNAQTTTVTIGSANASSNQLPTAVDDYVKNTMSQQIYTYAELSAAGVSNGDVITSIAFMPNTVYRSTANWSVYIVNTDKNSFESRTDYVTISNSANYEGKLTLTSGQWATINLTTPFTYTGGNILVCVLDYDENAPSSKNTYYVYSTSEISLVCYQIENVLDVTKNPTDGMGSTMLSYYAKYPYQRNYIQFTKSSGSVVDAPTAPENLRATAVTDISLNLSWDASANATSYNVYQVYQDEKTLISNVSVTSAQITGLNPDTEYCFTVTALNEGGEESSHSDELCVTTKSSEGSDGGKVIGGDLYAVDSIADPLPIYTTNEYAYSQQIYTKEELGISEACEINEISFYKTNQYSATRNLEIYMLNTDKESFSTNDWENIYDSYKVFDGEYTFTEQDSLDYENECKITLDNPFLYIPGKNILVCVVDKTATKEANRLYFQVYATGVGVYQSITTYGASKRKLSRLNGFSGINPFDIYGRGYKNKIKLYYQTASTGVLAIPSAIELAFALRNPDNGNKYWSEKSIHQKTITIIAKNTNITDISLGGDDASFFDIPDNIEDIIDSNVNPIVFEVGHSGTLESGSKTADLIITYTEGVDTVPLSAVTYKPEIPDVFELPREVDLSTGTYTDTPDFTTLHDDYILPGEGTDGNAPDAVYKFTLTEPKEVDVEVLGDKGIYAIYRAEDLIPYTELGPSSSNNFVPGASSEVDFFCDFDENGFKGLTLMNGVGDDDEGRKWEIGGEGLLDTEGHETNCAQSLSYYSYIDFSIWQTVEVFLSPENYLVTDKPYEITENSVLSFYAKSDRWGYRPYDGYKVMVSEDGNTFTEVFKKEAVETYDFEIQEIPLGAYKGQTLYIAINHYTDGIGFLSIDNLMLSKGGPGSGAGSSNIYPAGTYYVVAAAESEFTVRITVKMDEIPTFTGIGNWNEQARWNVNYIPNSADIDVIIDGTATITEDVVIRSVEIKEDRSLTVGANKLLTVVGLIETDNPNKLVLEDGAQLFQTNDELLGKFRMNIVAPKDTEDYNSKDTMNPTGWQFISSPMKNAATAGFETAGIGYDLFKYDGDVATEEDLEWINYKGHKDKDFEAKFQQGRGYMASYTVNGIAEFVGEFNNATNFTFDGLKYHDDDIDIKNQIDNFHLLGNPFTFNMKWNNDNIAASGLVEGYAVVTTAGGYTYATTGEIKVGDGFFVKVVGDAPSLTYTANTRGRNKDNNYINLIASGKAGQDNVIINFADNGRDGFDKLENFNKNIAEIYVKENESRYGILNYSEDVEEINIYFNAKQMGYYTINALTNADFANVTLVDRLTGVETDILTDSYTFQAMTDDAPDRFILRMNRQVESENFVYRSGEELIINAEGSVQIIDVMGRIVYSNEIVNDNHRVNIGSLKNAAYIVRVVNANEVKTQKVVIW